MNKNKLGKKLSEEHKQKISISKKGRELSVETRNNMSKARTGVKRPDLSALQLGRKRKPFTEEHLKNMRKPRLNKKENMEVIDRG